MSEWRVKLKQETRAMSMYDYFTWELQRFNPDHPGDGSDDEWEYANFGEAKSKEQAIKDAQTAMLMLKEEERIEAEAEYVLLD